MASRDLTTSQLAAHMAVFDRAIAQARAGEDIIERHPETGEEIEVVFIGSDIVLSTPTRKAFYRMRLNDLEDGHRPHRGMPDAGKASGLYPRGVPRLHAYSDDRNRRQQVRMFPWKLGQRNHVKRVDLETAKALARSHAAVLSERLGESILIYDEPEPDERGWRVSYDLSDVVTGKSGFGLAGNVPFLVTPDGAIEEPAG